MALRLSPFSSTLTFDPQTRSHFPQRNPVKFFPHSKPSSLKPLHVTLQDPQNPQTPNPKPQIWVNPNNPKAHLLRQTSYTSCYATLLNLALSLDSISPASIDAVSALLSAGLGSCVSEADALAVIENMSNPETAILALRFFQGRVKRETRLYNVMLKVMKKRRNVDGAEKVFEEMTERGVVPDNVTFCTLIGCARARGLPEKCVEWFERMNRFGIEPDDFTYSAMIAVYGMMGDVDRALSLYDRARSEKWRIDVMTFGMVVRIYAEAGNFDGCLNVYQEMRALGVKPNLFIYATLMKIYVNSGNFDGCLTLYEEMKAFGRKPSLFIYNKLLDAMGRARRPWKVTSIYEEMIDNGVLPNWGTYVALMHAYCRARYGEDAMKLYREMKEKGIELNVVLYNSLLAMCSDMGYNDDADEIFEDMKRSGTCKPDIWTFSAMISVFSAGGHVEKIEGVLNEMREARIKPDIFVLTSLIQCFGNANRTDDVLRTLDQLFELGFTPDEKFCACLLHVSAQMPKHELPRLMDCLERADPKLGYVVKLLVEGDNSEGIFRQAASELLNASSAGVRRGFCNSLIDLCVNLNLREYARDLIYMGQSLGIYTDIQLRTPIQWSLHLKSLSVGAASTALQVWINDLSEALENGEELPSVLGVNTGHGKHRPADKILLGSLISQLKELNSPFHEAPDKVGWFLTTKAAANSWLQGLKSEELVST